MKQIHSVKQDMIEKKLNKNTDTNKLSDLKNWFTVV